MTLHRVLEGETMTKGGASRYLRFLGGLEGMGNVRERVGL